VGGVAVGGPGAPTINAKKRIDGMPPKGAGAGGLEVEDVDGGPTGCLRLGRQRPPPKLKMSMAAP
jgi:hypothetical protein